jgi:uncharacterized protein (TIRG00374 family)
MQAVLVAAVLGAVALVISNAVPGSEARLRDLAPSWLALAVVLEVGSLIGYALLFHFVFSGGRYTLWLVRSVQIGLGELAGFVVAPAGVAGPALRIAALLRGGMPFPVVMTRSVVHAGVLNVPYVLAAIGLGLAATFSIGALDAPLALALAPLGLVLLAILFAGVAVRVARHARGVPRKRWRRIARQLIASVPAGLRELPGQLRKPRSPLSATAYWAGDCGVLIVAFHAVHGSAPVAVVVLAYMLGQLGNALPLPGGVGAVEPAMLGVLTASGVNLGLAGAAVVVYRFISLGLQAGVGAVAVATLIPALVDDA